MKARLKRSVAILKASISVFVANKKLLIFPLFSMLPAIMVFAFFALPLFNKEKNIKSIATNLEQLFYVLSNNLLLSVGIYLTAMFIFTFINVAFYHEILKAINGHPVKINRGFLVAIKKLKAIALWSLVSGVVGVIIHLLELQLEIFGRWIMSFIGFAWSVATVFAIPVLIREQEQSNPLSYLKHSARLISKTWGEAVIGFVAINIIGLVLIFGLVLSFVGLGLTYTGLTTTSGIIIFILGLLFTVLITLVISYVQNVATKIYYCALYVYASEGVVPSKFSQEIFDSSIKK